MALPHFSASPLAVYPADPIYPNLFEISASNLPSELCEDVTSFNIDQNQNKITIRFNATTNTINHILSNDKLEVNRIIIKMHNKMNEVIKVINLYDITPIGYSYEMSYDSSDLHPFEYSWHFKKHYTNE